MNKYFGYDKKIKKTISFNNEEILSGKIGLKLYSCNALFFCKGRNNTIIYSYDFNLNQGLWHYNLKQFSGYKFASSDTELQAIEVKKFLGVYQDTLWIVLSNGFLLGLDKESGEQKHYIGIADNNPAEKEHFERYRAAFFYRKYELDASQGKIILLSDHCYLEVDLHADQPVKICKDLTDEMEKHGLQCEMGGNANFQYDENYFYFYDGPKGIIAVMDRHKFKILWTHKLEVEVKDEFVLTLLRDLKVSKDHLYVHDRNNTLHIFEKENEITND